MAGIATANSYIAKDEGFVKALDEVYVQGVAPEAQLLTMKVFGKSGSPYDSDYFAAIEDARPGRGFREPVPGLHRPRPGYP